MAADPESLDVELATSVFKEMGETMEEETKLRQAAQKLVCETCFILFIYFLALPQHWRYHHPTSYLVIYRGSCPQSKRFLSFYLMTNASVTSVRLPASCLR